MSLFYLVKKNHAVGVIINESGYLTALAALIHTIRACKLNSGLVLRIFAHIKSSERKLKRIGNNGPALTVVEHYLPLLAKRQYKLIAGKMGVPLGAYIKEIYMDSPAMLAGIQRGDVIVEINGEAITRYTEYVNAILQLSPEDSVSVKVMRQAQEDYKEMSFEVTLESAK